MNLQYASLSKFYADLLARLVSEGLTVKQNLGLTDNILEVEEGKLFRLVAQTQGEVSSLGWDFGADAASLAAKSVDAESILPFKLVEGDYLVPQVNWYAPTKNLHIVITGTPETDGRRYDVSCNLLTKQLVVFHADRLNQSNEPNFKGKVAAYLTVGA